tara:strand:+ start:384 stop:551 length:168 start_codon:yes stop_codon:yes gene_type:complete
MVVIETERDIRARKRHARKRLNFLFTGMTLEELEIKVIEKNIPQRKALTRLEIAK